MVRRRLISLAVTAVILLASVPVATLAAGRQHSGKKHSAEVGRVQGTVTQAGKAAVKGAVKGARVTILPRRGGNRHGRLRRVVTSEAGQFQVSLPAGRYAVKVSKRGVGRAVTHVAVKAHGTSQVRVTLRAKHTRHRRKH